MRNIIMKEKELQQAQSFEMLVRKEITQKDVASRLNLTEKQIRRKLVIFKREGVKSLAHKNRDKPSQRKWDVEQEFFSINLLKTEWLDFGPKFASEKLLEKYNIKISSETLRNSMIKAGIWKVNSCKIQHKKRRVRKSAFGVMIQLDGSNHDWFEGRGPKCTLLVFIDDATSKIVWLEFAKSESYDSIMKATWNYFKIYGLPSSFYVDYGAVFSVNLNNPERDKITQWERALKELGISIIHANSPQAKGRVERSHKTHQDRLVKELRLANISTVEEANYFVQNDYIEMHNNKFAIEASDSVDLHRPIKGIDLNRILCIKEERILANDFTITFNKKILQLHSQQPTIIKPKNTITVLLHLDGSINLSIRKTNLYFSELSERAKKPMIEKQIKQSLPQKPSYNNQLWASGKLPINNSANSTFSG